MILPQYKESDASSGMALDYASDLEKLSLAMAVATADVPRLIVDYRALVNQICSICSRHEEHDDLVGLLCILLDGIDEVINDVSLISKARLDFLGKIPGLVSEHLNYPDSRMPCSVMVKYMSADNWVRPLTTDEQRDYIDRITHKYDVVTTDADSLTSEVSIYDFIESESDNQSANFQEDNESFSVERERHSIEDDVRPDALIEVMAEETVEDVIDIKNNPQEADLDYCPGLAATDKGDGFVKNAGREGYFVSEPDVQEISLDDLIKISVSETSEIPSFEISADHSSAERHHVKASDSHGISEKNQELVELVSAELMEIIEFYQENPITEEQDLSTVVKEASVQAGNIANAVKLIGLDALSELCLDLSKMFSQSDFVVNKSAGLVIDNLINWPRLSMAYLQAGFDDESSRQLIDYFENNGLIARKTDSEKKNIIDRLINPVFPEDDMQIRYGSARQEDVDLTLPDDVNPELLESLLQDLPKQTEELTSALLSMRDARDLAAIEIAQRIAHTLKGSANVVGVKGIANISHHLEDILEHLTKSKRLPSAQLMTVLMEASDCIESMADSLLGYDSPPEHALETLQVILNWSNRINEQGLDATVLYNGYDEVNAISQDDPPSASGVVKAKQNIVSHVENTLRIPAHLADDLLRLAGENLITTGQIQESISNSLNKQSLLKNHNRLLQQLAFDLEHLIDIQGITSNFNHASVDDKFDSLELDEYHELHTISRRLIEIAADSLALTNDLNSDLTDLHNLVISHGVIQRENQELVLRTRMLPVKSMGPRLKRGIRQICRLTGKEVDLDVIDNDVYLDSEVINQLIEPLMHLLRNAVDHGIEPTDVRLAIAKPEHGKIDIVFVRTGDSVQIYVSDDGQGLDADKIYAKAISRNLIEAGTELSASETCRLILLHGFSTRDEATQVSGRGVGLDVVSVKLRELKGSIDISSTAGAGCTFKLNLPVSSFSTHSMLVRVRQNIYAISSRGVEEILFPGSGELVDHEDGMYFEIGDKSYKAIVIDDLFNLDQDRRNIARNQRPIFLVKDEIGNTSAVLVQEVIDSRHVVVKPLGVYLPRLNGIIGSTILGDGSVAPVIDLPEFLQTTNAYGETNEFNADSAGIHQNQKPYVLVVDDSLSARRSLMHFVEDMGFEVREARDGIEAVSMIAAHRPDLVLADMEMPRMNGLELTAHIRTNHVASTLPVIMITSRSSEKHRQVAMERGINYFMVKPFAEDELAQQINALLH
jgi:chemosensory pili system protein ChpA (sensor histidine kinase/response regulator)